MEENSTIASKIAARSVIKDPTTKAFSKTGRAAATIVWQYYQAYAGHPLTRVLDFGCGSGRVVIPLSQMLPEVSFDATDIDAEAVAYLKNLDLANVDAMVNSYEGGLPYEDGRFDAVYAISIWSHFPEDLSRHWLGEMARVLRPGGLSLLTVGGLKTLGSWRETHHRWRNITEDDFERSGFLYIEFAGLGSQREAYPGVTKSWGNALIHEDYIRAEWKNEFDVLTIDPSGMNGNQDVVVLRRK